MRQKQLRVFQADAFTPELFKGNPAAVILTHEALDRQQMLNIAAEINLSETAFLIPIEGGLYSLRWFTPKDEVRLCGHATLAAAHILYTEYGCIGDVISFDTLSGRLSVRKLSPGRYLMDFPADFTKKDQLDDSILLSIRNHLPQAIEIMHGNDDLLVIFKNEEQVKNFEPDHSFIRQFPFRGLIVSSVSDHADFDFCSRCFYPVLGVDEDPVTGSAHTLLTTYWALALRKNRLNAIQLSSRTGRLECIWKGSRVALIGQAVTVMSGMMRL